MEAEVAAAAKESITFVKERSFAGAARPNSLIGAVLALEPILAMIRTIPPASAFAAAAIATRSALPCRPLVRSS